jgi:hypothetical protein
MFLSFVEKSKEKNICIYFYLFVLCMKYLCKETQKCMFDFLHMMTTWLVGE